MDAQKLTILYNQMIARYEERPKPINRFNTYRCTNCQHITKTKDIDNGVTPFMHTCEECNFTSHSQFYKFTEPHLTHTQEWYRPSLAETLSITCAATVTHILNGGLLNRPVQ